MNTFPPSLPIYITKKEENEDPSKGKTKKTSKREKTK